MVNWEEIYNGNERKLRLDLARKIRNSDGNCEHLMGLGDTFFYCKCLAESFIAKGSHFSTASPEPKSAEYQAGLDTTELQIFCMDKENYHNCSYFGNSQ